MKAILLLFLPALALADNAPEVNAVRDRARAYQEESESELTKVRRFNSAARELGWRAQEIAAAVAVTKLLPPAHNRLQELAREQVYVEGIQDKLEAHDGRIRDALALAAAAARELPDLAGAWSAESARIAGSLDRLRAGIAERRARAAGNREAWLAEQREATMREIANGRLQAVDDLKFAEKVRNAHHAFASVRRAFLKAGMEGNREQAEHLLTGFRWLKGVLPLYLPLADQKRVDTFRLLDNALGEVEAKMAAELGRWPREGSRFLPLASLRLSTYPKVPPNKPSNHREKPEKGEGGREYIGFDRGDGDIKPSIEFFRFDVPPPSKEFIERRLEFLRRNKTKEEKPAKPVPEVKKTVRDHARRHRQPKPTPDKPKPERPATVPELQEETRELRELVRQAERDSDDHGQQAEVREISAELTRYEALQGFYGKELEKESAELRGLMASAAAMPAEVASMPSAPAPVRGAGHEAEELALELGKTIADSALGLIPGYDLANFGYAMATGQSFLGDEVHGEDKLMLGVFAVMSVIPAGTVASNSLRQLKNLKKVDKAVAKLLSSALAEMPEGLAKLRPVLAKAGTSGEFAVIGRSMGGPGSPPGILELVDYLRSRGLKVHHYPPDPVLMKSFKEEVRKNGGKHFPLPELRTKPIFVDNRNWSLKMKNAGHGILDMGNPHGLEPSLFLDHAEREVFDLLKGIHVHHQ